MVIHSGSLIQLLAWLLTLGALIGLLVSVVLLIARKYRVAAKVLAISLAAVGVYAVAATAISWLAPQKIIKLGDSYCWDSWCMGIERMNSTSRGREVEYKVDVHIFSEIGLNAKASASDASVLLLDERGRRFPLVNDPSVIPFDTSLGSGQSIRTTLTFVAAADAGHLFLTGEPRPPLPVRIPLAWRFFVLFMDLHFGYEHLSHKPTLLRVL